MIRAINSFVLADCMLLEEISVSFDSKADSRGIFGRWGGIDGVYINDADVLFEAIDE